MNHTPNLQGDTPALEADRHEEMTAVGGCNGICMVPRRHIDDYYQAHGYVAAGAVILLGLKSLGALAF